MRMKIYKDLRENEMKYKAGWALPKLFLQILTTGAVYA